MLDFDNALAFLLDRGWVDPEWIVDGDLAIRGLDSRNRNLKVEGPGNCGFVIKQPDGLASDCRRTLANEAIFYEFCRDEPAVEALSVFLPRMVHRDVDRSLLILELVAGAETLGTSEDDPFPAEGCRKLGQAMGTLHRLFRLPGLGDDPRLGWLGRSMPWAFQIQRPWPGLLGDLSPASLRVHQIVQEQAGLDAIIDRVRARWRPETVIHGDVKGPNVLVRRTGDSTDSVEIHWIDWELVQIGDPAWDLAGALQSFLFHWVASMPAEPELEADERIQGAKSPLDALRPSIRALWEGYRSSSGIDSTAADELLARAVEFSSVRLIQTTLELSSFHPKLTSKAVLLLQVCANLLANPLLGQLQLYGIPRESFST